MRTGKLLRAAVRGCTACAVLAAAGVAQGQVVEIVNTEPGVFMDISGTGTPLGLSDDGDVAIFTSLFGDIRIDNNGAIAFSATGSANCCDDDPLPASGLFGGGVESFAVYWDDLDADNGNVYWQEMADRVIVQWHNRPHFSGSASNQGVIIQVQLFPNATNVGDIKAQYLYPDTIFDGQTGWDNGASATIGWQLSDAGPFAQWSYNTAGAVMSGDVLTLRLTSDDVGACCFPDGTCAELPISSCATSGGTHNGAGTTCGTTVCPDLTGQCCLLDGTCLETTEGDCTSQNGAFGGLGTDCTTTCPDLSPPNDDCATATVITAVPFSDSVPNMEYAGSDPDLTACNSSSATVMNNAVWWTFAGTGQRMRVTMDDINFDGAFAVFEGADCNTLFELDCADPAPFTLDFDTQVGMNYYFVAMQWSLAALSDLNNEATITLDVAPAPAMNDLCTTAAQIASVPFSGTVPDMENLTADPDITSCNSSSATVMNNSAWWSFQGTGQRMRVTMDDINFDGSFAVFEGPDCNTLFELGCSDPAPWTFDFDTQVGMTYFFVAMQWSSSALSDTGNEATISLDVAPAAPGNDDCGSPTILMLDVAASGTTDGAVGTDVASCGADERDVWFAFLPAANTTYTVSTTGATQNLSVAVYNQDCPDLGGVELACADLGGNDTGTVFSSDSNGSAIFIRIASDDGSIGTSFDVVVSVAPPGFLCDDAVNIASLPFSDAGNSVLAGSDGPAGSCNTGGAPSLDNSVWYSYTPAITMDVEITMDPTNFDGLTVVFEGADCGSLFEVACADEPEPNVQRVTLTGGQTYFIAIGDWGTSDAGGDYTIDIVEVAGACTGTGGLCSQELAADCGAQGGTFIGGDCPLGACCTAGVCTTVTSGDCAAGGGVYQGDGTNCGGPDSGALALPIGPGSGVITEHTITASGQPNTIAGMEVRVRLDHTFLADLEIDVIHVNSGTTVRVMDDQCGLNDNMDVIFRDGAPAIACGTPTVGTFAPLNPLSAFDGLDANSNWTLRIRDDAGGDAGTLLSWGLGFDGAAGPCDGGPACVCELDGDSAQVNVFDLLAFLDLWFANAPGADIDGNPGVDVFDLLAFLDCWFPASAGAPCP